MSITEFPSNDAKKANVDRPLRRSAHLLAELRRYRWLPFMVHDVKLLNLSTGGVKLAFPRKFICKAHETFWFRIPLYSYSDKNSDYLEMRIECRWFNADSREMGGSFIELNESTMERIAELIEELRVDGRLAV